MPSGKYKRTEAIRKKISLSQTGKKLSLEHRRNLVLALEKRYREKPEIKKRISEKLTGVKKSPEAIKKMKENYAKGMRPGMKGKHHTQEAKDKVGLFNKGRKHSMR